MVLSQITDQNLRHTLQFGIGLHHAGLNDHDRSTVEELFTNNKIQALPSTYALSALKFSSMLYAFTSKSDDDFHASISGFGLNKYIGMGSEPTSTLSYHKGKSRSSAMTLYFYLIFMLFL